MNIKIAFKEKLGAPEWNLDLNVIGAGKIDNPFIISPPKYTSSEYCYDRGRFSLRISESKNFAEFRNYYLRAITLVNCDNLTIVNSNIKTVTLINCSNILIKNSLIRKKLIIESCHFVDLIYSKIHLFDARTSEDILASNCQFDRVKKRSYSCSLTIEHSEILGLKSYIKILMPN